MARKREPGLVLPPLGALPLSAPFAYGGAFLSGILYWLPFPVAMHRQTARRALLLGWLAGLTMNVFGFFWLASFLETFSGFPLPLRAFFMLVVCGAPGR